MAALGAGEARALPQVQAGDSITYCDANMAAAKSDPVSVPIGSQFCFRARHAPADLGLLKEGHLH